MKKAPPGFLLLIIGFCVALGAVFCWRLFPRDSGDSPLASLDAKSRSERENKTPHIVSPHAKADKNAEATKEIPKTGVVDTLKVETPESSINKSKIVTEMRENQTKLMESRQKLMEDMKGASPEEMRSAMEKWQSENAQALAKQQQLASQLRSESRSSVPPDLPEPRIPENASPEMRELITARHALMKDQMETMRSLETVSPEERRIAMEEWRTENTKKFEAVHAAAKKLSESQPKH